MDFGVELIHEIKFSLVQYRISFKGSFDINLDTLETSIFVKTRKLTPTNVNETTVLFKDRGHLHAACSYLTCMYL